MKDRVEKWRTMCIKLKEENKRLKDEVDRLKRLVDEYQWVLGIESE